ncbi:MAG: helix-turn-helix domain-containing protein [Pseudolabrys sp.]|nr:helix-turn-helix domain-containing protein [Pseudolabrys sp.]
MESDTDQLSHQSLRSALKAERWLKRKELELYLGVSYPTIWKWVRASKFPAATDLNGMPRWSLKAVDAWLEAQPQRAAKAPALSSSSKTKS